jgi:hypothetical protein
VEAGGNDMTQKEAKELTIEVWTYLAEHPEIECKWDLPDHLWDKICDFTAECPLCELFNVFRNDCPGCPLNTHNVNCYLYGSPFSKWSAAGAGEEEIRARRAQDIVDIVSAWEPEEK